MKSLIKDLIIPFLSEADISGVEETVGIFGGGFQPPTKGHFEVVKKALEMYPGLNQFIVYVGTGGGRSDITQEQSLAIWDIYKQYLPSKVSIVPSSSPVYSVYSYAKDNPTTQIKWFLGSRKDNIKDFEDFEKRTKSVLSRTNLEPINITTTNNISGTAARAILDDKEKFFEYLPNIEEEDKEKIYSILKPESEEGANVTTLGTLEKPAPKLSEKIQGDSIVCDNCEWTWKIKDGGNDLYICHKCGHDNTPKETNNFFDPIQDYDLDIKISSEPTRIEYYKDHIKNVIPSDFKVEKHKNKIIVTPTSKQQNLENNSEFKKLLVSLTIHMMDHINIEPLPDLIFIEDDKENASHILGKTAHYNPEDNSITLYTCGRHPKDILRSYAHELIHHMQNLEGRINNIQGDNINEDDYLAELELEAYSKGNILFRGWENLLNGNINEWVIDIPKYDYPKTLAENLWHTLNEITLNPSNAVEIYGDLTNGKFQVGDNIYVYDIKQVSNPYNDGGRFFNIMFHPEDNKTDVPTGTSTKEDYIKILSTMYKIILDFAEEAEPEYIGISSMDNTSHKNYHRVYNNLTDNRYNRIPEYFRKDANLKFSTPQGKGRFIVLKRKND
jgi:hypothetical protein